MSESSELEYTASAPGNLQSRSGDQGTIRATFYGDEGAHGKHKVLAIKKKDYPTFDSLQDYLSGALSVQVRSITTPMGRHRIRNMAHFTKFQSAQYICSSKAKVRGVNLSRSLWNTGNKPSLDRGMFLPSDGPRKSKNPLASRNGSDPGLMERKKQPKKLMLISNKDKSYRRTILLNRSTDQVFEQVVSDIGELFNYPINVIFKETGEQVQSLTDILRGPDCYIVAEEGEEFIPLEKQTRPQKSLKPVPLAAWGPDGKMGKTGGARTRGHWQLILTTNDRLEAGTTANVSITVYGAKGNSHQIPLGVGDGTNDVFQSGNVDQFEISVGNIGKIYKIRLSHDNSGDSPSWLPDEATMLDVHTKESLNFEIRRFISDSNDDLDTCREFAVTRPGEPVLPVTVYNVAVTTGNLWNACTEANVYITIYGEHGDTGVRRLARDSALRESQLTMGQTDVFQVEAVYLGKLKRVIIGHDGNGPGAGWYLEKLSIQESGTQNNRTYVFHCLRWLDEGEDDGKIVRELKTRDDYSIDSIEKTNWEYEKWKFETGTCIRLYSVASGRPLRIKPDATVDADGDYDDPLASAVLWKQSIFKPMSRRTNIRVFQSYNYDKFHLAIDNAKLLGQKGRGGTYCEQRVRVQPSRAIMFESVKFTGQFMAVKPSGKPDDPRTGGTKIETSRLFHVYCKGMLRDRGVIMLCTSLSQTLTMDEDNTLISTGKRNQMAHFRVHKVAEGGVRMFESIVYPKQFIRMKQEQCDLLGTGDVYCQFKAVRNQVEGGWIHLVSMESHGSLLGMSTNGIVKPTTDTGEINTRFYPEVIEWGTKKGETPKENKVVPVETKLRRKRRQPVPDPLPLPVEKAAKESPREESAQSHFEEGDWKVWINTSESAQNADVVLVVYGEDGCSGPIILGTAGENDMFAAGNQDQFKVNLGMVGKLYKIRLELLGNNSKKAVHWAVKDVKLKDMTSRAVFKFKFNRTFGQHTDDGDTMHERPAIYPKETAQTGKEGGLPVVTYTILVYTANEPGADTDANVFLTAYGERGDWGRRQLHKSTTNETKFEEGQCDEFMLEAVSLGDLRQCVLDHDGKDPFEGWLCEKVIIREGDNPTHEWVFPCAKWLDTGIDDKVTECVLDLEVYRPIPDEEEKEKHEPLDWSVYITTGKEKHMGTDAKVKLIVYGDKGKTDPLPLDTSVSGGPVFQPDGNDDIKINLGKDIGEIYKIRIGHSDARPEQGWFLEKVTMRDLNTNEVFTFRFKRWLSRGEDDKDTWREQPVVREGTAPFPMVRYIVEVYTGSLPGAATDARAYVHLFGTNGDAGRRALAKSNNNAQFRSGQRDVFKVEAVSLQTLQKVILGHNGKKKGAGWYVEKVVVWEADDPEGATVVFPCSRWLDVGQDDGKIERELLPGEDEEYDWTVWVTTGREMGMGTQNSITLVAYGDKDHTDELPLEPRDPSMQTFKPGGVDEFKLNLGTDIGRLYKIRVGHDSADIDQGWYLGKIKVKDNKSEEMFSFKLERWLNRDKDDHDTWREMAAVYPDEVSLPLVTYLLEVHTGTEPGADTQANCYIHVFGLRGDAGRRTLVQSDRSQKFRKGQVDIFTMDAVSLDDITKVILGHDGDQKGAGWFVSKVVIRESDGETPSSWEFPCNQWFDKGQDDGKIERELAPVKPVEKEETIDIEEEKEEGFLITVKTSRESRCPRRSAVTLTVYGSDGKTDDLQLNGDSLLETVEEGTGGNELFQPGSVHSFNVELEELGELYKARVGRQEGDDWDGWCLDEVVLLDKSTKEEYNLWFGNRWMARDEDDCDIVRELPLTKEGKEPLPVVQYEVAVYTGDHWAADTVATVHIHLHGSRGDAGRRALYRSQNTLKFQRNQIDTFIVEAVDLEDIERVVVGHDGLGHGAGWFLDKIIITKTCDVQRAKSAKKGGKADQKGTKPEEEKVEGGDDALIFYCGRWLDTEEGDGKTEVELRLMESRDKSEVQAASNKDTMERRDTESQGVWEVVVTTGDVEKADTSAQVYLTVYGQDRVSQRLPLGKAGGNHFQRGMQSTHKIKLDELGELYKVCVEHDNSGSSPSWYLQMLTMESAASGDLVRVYADRWLAEDEGDRLTRRELPILHQNDVMSPVILKYQVSITTGDVDDADTSSNVCLTIKGSKGQVTSYPLVKSSSGSKLWRRGQTDELVVEAVYLGNLEEMTLEHDGIQKDSAWFVEKVVIKETEHALNEWVFPGHQFVVPTKLGPASKTFSCMGLMKLALQPSVDNKNTHDKRKRDEKKKNDKNFQSKGAWSCTISSADLPLGGGLSIKAYGMLGESEELHLLGENTCRDRNESKNNKNAKAHSKDKKSNKDKNNDKYKNNKDDAYKNEGQLGKNGKESKDKDEEKDEEEKDKDEKEKARQNLKASEEIKVNVGNIGVIFKIRLVYIGEKEWFMHRLKMKDDDTSQEFHFLYDSWMIAATSTQPYTKDMAAIMPDTTPLQECVYEVSVMTGNLPRAETKADVYCTLVGNWGDTGQCLLDQSTLNGQPFRQGQLDMFKLSVLHVGVVKKVVLGHNTRGRGQGWHCNHVTLRANDAQNQTVFPCNRWFDTGCEDRLTIRELLPDVNVTSTCKDYEDEGPDKRPMTNGIWTCLITVDKSADEDKNSNGKGTKRPAKDSNKGKGSKDTGRNDKDTTRGWEGQEEGKGIDKAGVERPYGPDYVFGQIMLMVFGERGTAGPLMVASDTDNLQLGVAFEKELVVGDIGAIQKVRVVDGTLHQRKTLAWQVALVKLTDADTAEELMFDFRAVVGEETPNACRELPAISSGRYIEPLVMYRVGIHSFDLEPERSPTPDRKDGMSSSERDEKEDNDHNSKQNAKENKNKNKSNNDKNMSKSKQGQKNSDKQKNGSEMEKDKNMGQTEVWLCLYGLNGDSGWHKVPVTKTKDNVMDTNDPEHDIKSKKDTRNDKDKNQQRDKIPQSLEEQKNEAATKIQANYRGFRERKKAKSTKDANKEDPEDLFSLTVVDLGTITKVTVVNVSGEDVAIKEVIVSAGHFSVRQQVFRCLQVLKAKSKTTSEDEEEEEVTSPRNNSWQYELMDHHFGDVITPAAVPLNTVPELNLPKSEGSWLVTTWTGSAAGKSPGVTVVVCGRDGESKPLPLTESTTDNPSTFQAGQEDTFRVQILKDIGEIFKVRVGFADTPLSSTSWTLKKIHFINEATGDDFTCLCDRVLMLKDPSDGWYELPVLWPSVPQLKARLYEMTVYTGEVDNADTDANVYVIVNGNIGTSGTRQLRRSETFINKFEKGQVDKFTMEAVDLGDLEMVTIGHDGTDKGSGWFLEKIVIEEGELLDDTTSSNDGLEKPHQKTSLADDTTDTELVPPIAKRVFVFPCNRWLDKGEEDGLTELDLYPLPLEEPAKEFTWQLTVKTAEVAGNEEPPPPSEAPRVVILYGENGKTEPLTLKSTEKDLFRQGFTNEFDLRSQGDIGSLYKMRLGYADGTEGDHTWHLELVRLHCNETGDDYEFETGAQSVVMNSKKDGWTELPVRASEQLTVKTYHVETHTGNTWGAGTDANIYIEIYGDQGDTGRRRLLDSLAEENMFEAGKVDRFEVSAVNLSALTKVIVGHDGKGIGSGWFLDRVVIKESETSDKKFIFNCDKWLDEGEDDGALERELELTEVDDGHKAGDHKVLVTTHEDKNSGTEAEVSLTVFGERGDTGPQPLIKEGAFKEGVTDEFTVHIDPERVGKITKIRLEHDNAQGGTESGWHVVKVVLTDMGQTEPEQLDFTIDRWLCDAEDDGDVVREVAAKWPGEEPLPAVKYEVQIVTMDELGAGTDANVYIILHGKTGDSGYRHLMKSKAGGNKFEAGKTDTFSVEAVGLGPLERVTVGHDGEGSGSAWRLEGIKVKVEDAEEQLDFPCAEWLQEDDGTQERVLQIFQKEDGSS